MVRGTEVLATEKDKAYTGTTQKVHTHRIWTAGRLLHLVETEKIVKRNQGRMIAN